MNVLISGGALAVAGTSVIGTVATGIIFQTGGLLSYLWYGSRTNIQLRDYHRRIMRLDIPDKVKLAESLLDGGVMETGIRSVTERILRQLSDINEKLAYHQTVWFSSYRNIDIDEELKDLESLTEVLDKKILLLKA